ncbi:MAG TPA: hypothetical protein VFS00_05605, partial [Polyangiaceae bacterium]|nr:hypothetical protein [Polyangiaceae bacterium]
FERRALRGTPPAFEPAGAYAFASWVGRGARRRDVSGTLRVRAAPGGYAGTLATSLGPELPLAEVFAAGRHLWVRAVAPDGDEYELPLEIEGEAVRGRFIAGFGNNRPLSGRRLSGP